MFKLPFFILMTAIWILYIKRTNSQQIPEECPPSPMLVDIMYDWTNNMTPLHRKMTEQTIVKIVSHLPDHCSVNINALGDNFLSEIVSLSTPFENTTLLKKLNDYDHPRSGGTVLLSSIDEELERLFSANNYRQKAELAIIFVSDSTDVVGLSQLLYKKKAIFIVFGEHIPNVYRDMAANEKHVHLVARDAIHLTNVTDTILVQVFCASNFPCDRDQYRNKWGITCMNCSDKCGDGMVKVTLACSKCPYLYRPPPKAQHYPVMALLDQKWFVILLILISVILLVISIIVAFTCWRFHRKRKQKPQLYLKDKMPIAEQGENDPEDSLHNQTEGQTVESQSENSSGEETGDSHSGLEDENTPLVDGQLDLPSPDTIERSAVDESQARFINEQGEHLAVELGEGNSTRISSKFGRQGPIVIDFANVRELEANGNAFATPMLELHSKNIQTEGTEDYI